MYVSSKKSLIKISAQTHITDKLANLTPKSKTFVADMLNILNIPLMNDHK